MKKSNRVSHKWFLVGLMAVIIAAPNATVVKFGVNSMSPILYNAIRFTLIGIVTLPFLARARHLITKTNLKNSIIGGIAMTIAVFSFIGAIKLSQASYVSIITLITPVFFILFSNKVTGEKINRRSLLGILLVMIGAMIVVLLPIAIKQSGNFVFYPLATLLALINTITFPIGVIYYKKANDDGLPIVALLSISAWITALANVAVLTVIISYSGSSIIEFNRGAILAAAYSGLAVALLARILNVKSYEHIGAVRTSALSYLETFLAIVIPVVVLHEKLSVYMIVGGIVILVGVYIVEYHKSVHHKHHYIFRHH